MAEEVLLAEGKTKRIFRLPGKSGLVRVQSKADITAGDGAKRDSFPHKDQYATATTVAVFNLLNACGISTAFVESLSPTEFIARECAMLPYEMVARRIALGSYLKRSPRTEARSEFPALVVEFFLKTTDRKFKGITFPKDDPIIGAVDHTGLVTYRPDMPESDPANAAIKVPDTKIYGRGVTGGHPVREMEELVRRVFLVLEAAWRDQGCQLADLKIECGYAAGKLVVADVIDNDSWRLFDAEGMHLDKQRYRDGADLKEVAALYADVARRVERFRSLHAKPTIVLWRASDKDDPRPFMEALRTYGSPVELVMRMNSVHKMSEHCVRSLRATLSSAGANTVVIAYVGRSNGAGPVFAADTHVPVITVPASVKEFPDDIWSSLRMPSDVPLMTVLEPANAIQAALGILSARSPHAYMARRMVVEHYKLDRANSPTFGT